MEILHKLRFVIYSAVFAVVFLLASYCSFPKDVLKDMAETSITNLALGMGPKNRGLPHVVTQDASLWRMSGLSLEGLKITWPPQKNKNPIVMEFDSIKGRVGIFALLTGSKNVYLTSNLYGGQFDADFKVRPKNDLGYLNLTASKLDLAKMSFFEAILGAPLQGVVNVSAAINANSELSKDGTGSIKLNWENLSYGPGSVQLPAGGFVSSLTVPQISLGKLSAELVLDKGQIESKSFTLSGGDLEADIKISISVGRQASSSRLSGDGWFSVKREFVNANETLKMLYDLIPELREAQSGNGKVGLVLRGNLARPQPRLERYQEKAPKAEPEAKK